MNPPCPHCGYRRTKFKEVNRAGNTQYRCGSCRRGFTPSGRKREGPRRIEVGGAPYLCKNCGSDLFVSGGKTPGGFPRVMCVNCKKRYYLTPEQLKRYKKKEREQIIKYLRNKKRTKLHIKPDCTDDYTFNAWLEFTKVSGNFPRYGYCSDCTRAHAEKMREEGRCSNTKLRFK